MASDDERTSTSSVPDFPEDDIETDQHYAAKSKSKASKQKSHERVSRPNKRRTAKERADAARATEKRRQNDGTAYLFRCAMMCYNEDDRDDLKDMTLPQLTSL